MLILGMIDRRSGAERRHDLPQQNPEPADQAARAGIASMEPEIVAAYAMLGLEMAYDGLDRGPAAKFTLI